jgi:hypothetical protein
MAETSVLINLKSCVKCLIVHIRGIVLFQHTPRNSSAHKNIIKQSGTTDSY